MLTTAFQAAHSLARQVTIESPSLGRDKILRYTAQQDGLERHIETGWQRAVWHTAYCFSEELLGFDCDETPLLTACRLDWQERVRLSLCYVRDGNLIYKQGEQTYTEAVLPRNTVRLAQAIRAGYYMIEIPGEGLIVRSPKGHQHGVNTDRCSCSMGTGNCIHRVLFNAFIQRRSTFQELTNAYAREYQDRLPSI